MGQTLTPTYRTFADVLDRLGGVPPNRVRFDVNPGRATVRDLIREQSQDDRLYELVDGFLVEKTYGALESYLAVEIGASICGYLLKNDLGFVLGVDGAVELSPGQVRSPDVSFFSWDVRPDRTIPDEDVPKWCPDLAVEVLSLNNSRKEIQRKLKECFLAGTRLVWVIDPRKREAKVYVAPDRSETVSETGHLDGGDVLPGFRLELKTLFGKLGAKKSRRK